MAFRRRITQEELSLPVPAGSSDEAYIQLRKLGFDEMVLSSNTEAVDKVDVEATAQ